MVKIVSVQPLFFTLLLSLASCNFQESKLDPELGFGEFSQADLNYESVNRRIITPYCLNCHSAAAGNRAGINLETLESITSRIPTIERTVLVEKTMPPSPESPLPNEAILMLDAWLELGAPE